MSAADRELRRPGDPAITQRRPQIFIARGTHAARRTVGWARRPARADVRHADRALDDRVARPFLNAARLLILYRCS